MWLGRSTLGRADVDANHEIGVSAMASTDRNEMSAHDANAPGWKLVGGRWLWWDGDRYTMEWDGEQHRAVGEPSGAQPRAGQKPGVDPGGGSATASLVLGLLGIPFFWLVFILPTLAIVYSLTSRNQSRRAGFEWSTGRRTSLSWPRSCCG